MVQFKKGDKVVMLRNWDDLGGVSARELTIKSWGKTQATAIRENNGEFLKERLYTENANGVFYDGCALRNPEYFFLSDSIDVEAEALKYAERWIASRIEAQIAAIEKYGDKEGRRAQYLENFRSMRPAFVGFK